MPLSSEVFVMVIFIAGIAFFYLMLRDSNLQGRIFFTWVFVLLTFSNIFTVVEAFWLNRFFNFCEHLFIAAGSVMLLIAVLKLTAKPNPTQAPRISDSLKD